MKRSVICIAATVCLVAAAFLRTAAARAGTDYGLQPMLVAPGVYVFSGLRENFSRDNGGNIVNTGFLVGSEGVVVIDTGPSRLYGEQQDAAIRKTTPLPVAGVFITHAHPDHFLGDQAYPPESSAALPGTQAAIAANGEGLSSNLYRLVGGWMRGTQVVVPVKTATAGDLLVGGRRLRLIAAAGHTASDLVVVDLQTQTVFAGDLVFFDRAPTTPDANLPQWLEALDAIDKMDFKTLVTGHGPVVHDHAAIQQTRDYLTWLRASLTEAAARGLDMTEVMRLPLPARFRNLAVVDGEYVRSVEHLYPAIELQSLPALTPR